jgi:hypothetical protein
MYMDATWAQKYFLQQKSGSETGYRLNPKINYEILVDIVVDAILVDILALYFFLNHLSLLHCILNLSLLLTLIQ